MIDLVNIELLSISTYAKGKGMNASGTYFDSYELSSLDSRFLLCLRRNSITHCWNTTLLQGMLSQTCGLLCIFIFYV